MIGLVKNTLMIIDGSSLLYRAFYALPMLSNKDGIYTNGVYGFLTMFYKLKEEYNPDYLCVAFDKKGPTFRHESFKEYKANRDEAPNELSLQFPILKEVLNAMNIRQLEIDDYEADDIAGTVAKIGEENEMDVILVTGDKDYLQLISNGCNVLLTKRGITELQKYDMDVMLKEYGITPEQFIDLKGFMGDPSDNIPGVPGIGEKTGLKLIKEFGSMESVYENIDKVGGKKRRESLIEYRQQAFMSRKLAEIVTNVPLDLNIEETKIVEPSWRELNDIYERLEFNSLIDKIPKDKIEKNYETIKTSFQIVKSISDYNRIIKEIESARKFAFKFIISDKDIHNNKILGVAIKATDFDTNYISFDDIHLQQSFVDKFKVLFERKDIKKIGHNLKIDIVILLKLGIGINSYVFDSMIGKYLINPSQTNYDISKLADEYLNIKIKSEEDLLGKGKNKKTYTDLTVMERGQYASSVLESVYMLEEPILDNIHNYGMDNLYYDVELPLVEVLASMECYGFKIDLDIIGDLGEEFDKEIESLTGEIYDLAGEEFNINSPKQLGEILFDKLNLPVIKKTKTGYSTDAEVLDKLLDEHPIIEKILKYRQIIKLKSTYIDGLKSLVNKETNRIHSSFNQTVTNTGRISSTEPNLQNIPVKTEEGREIRKAFVPEDKDYILIDGDYSQIELRVLAHISDDPNLKEAFYNDEDIHTKTASQVFDVPINEVTPLMRNRAKAVNFGIVYGISDYGLSKDLNISRKEAKEYIDGYLKNYSKVHEYMNQIVKEGKEKGYVETILHRRRYLPELKSKNYMVRSFGERIAMNTPIQGSAADIIKVAMINMYNKLKSEKLKSRLILQVHDELIIEAHVDEVERVKKMLQEVMEEAITLNVPLKVDIKVGKSWYETK